jgi:hypothetical protein
MRLGYQNPPHPATWRAKHGNGTSIVAGLPVAAGIC